jgi:hypothetical protein
MKEDATGGTCGRHGEMRDTRTVLAMKSDGVRPVVSHRRDVRLILNGY